MTELSENNRRWWESEVIRLERAVVGAEAYGDSFLARAEAYTLSYAKKQLAGAICNG